MSAIFKRLVAYHRRLDFIWTTATFWTRLGIVVFLPITILFAVYAVMTAISLALFGPDIARVIMAIVFLWAAAMFMILKFIPLWLRSKDMVK